MKTLGKTLCIAALIVGLVNVCRQVFELEQSTSQFREAVQKDSPLQPHQEVVAVVNQGDLIKTSFGDVVVLQNSNGYAHGLRCPGEPDVWFTVAAPNYILQGPNSDSLHPAVEPFKIIARPNDAGYEDKRFRWKIQCWAERFQG